MRKLLKQWLWRQLVDASIMTMPTTKKKACASRPSADLDITPSPLNNNLVTLATTATTLAAATTALFSDAAWAINANGTMRTPSAQSSAKYRQVMPAVDGILRPGSAVQQGAPLRTVTDHPLMASA